MRSVFFISFYLFHFIYKLRYRPSSYPVAMALRSAQTLTGKNLFSILIFFADFHVFHFVRFDLSRSFCILRIVFCLLLPFLFISLSLSSIFLLLYFFTNFSSPFLFFILFFLTFLTFFLLSSFRPI